MFEQPVFRRDWMKLAAAGVAGVSASGWFDVLARQAGAAAKEGVKHKACILLWMAGGPAQSHTFDLKSGSDFQAIGTAVPGVKVSEEITKVQEVSKRLKGLGKDLGCLMFALSQLTPDAASLEPTPMMLRGSKQIMQDADIIFLMSRKEHRNDRADGKT